MRVRSTSGAQRNLKEYARVARLKYPMTSKVMPALRNHADSESKIRRFGSPAANPRRSITMTRRSVKTRSADPMFRLGAASEDGDIIDSVVSEGRAQPKCI